MTNATVRCILRGWLLVSLLNGAWHFGGNVMAADLLPDIPAGTNEVRLTVIATNLHDASDGTVQINPTGLYTDGSGRLFITTLGGVIRILNPEGTLLWAPYLNTTRDPATGLSDPRSFNVSFRHGLTSLAFHSQFHQPGQPGFGKFYTILDQTLNSGTPDFVPLYQDSSYPPTPFDQVLVEWTAADPEALAFTGTRREIFRVRQPKDDHNASRLVFGPDGYLYMDLADGGNVRDNQLPPHPGLDGTSAHAQDRRAIFGKIIRIDPLHPTLTPQSGDLVSSNGNYRVPVTNPFATDGDPNTLGEIYSYGHRTIYGLSFDPVNGNLYDFEVGQVTIEEVNRIVPGGNYGWNLKEGAFLYNEADQGNDQPDIGGAFAQAHGLIEPILQYDHGDGQCIIGGGIYRGRSIPSIYGRVLMGELQGRYVGGVTTGGRLFHGSLADGTLREFVLSTNSAPVPKLIYAVHSDDDGEYYVLGGATDFSSGVLLKLNAPSGPASFAEWAAALLPAGQRGSGDQPFGDGIPNLVRFAFAIPASPLTRAPSPVHLTVQSGGTATLAYRASAPGILYRPQWSQDLAEWQDAVDGGLIGGQPTSVEVQGPEVRVHFPALDRLFVRVQIQAQ